MSVPSRDLIDSIGPSTASMVPRIRTVGGCCADAADPSRVTKVSEAASIRGHEEDFGMVFLPRYLAPNSTQTPHGRCYSRRRFFTFLLPLWALWEKEERHIGGVSPSRPTLTRLVSSEPSGSFFMKAITLAPGLRSDLSAGT